MKKQKNFKLLAVILCAVVLVSALIVTVFAAGETKTDATVAIEAAFSDKKIGDTQKLDKDGYIGIPLEITTYYDYAAHGAAKPGYNATIAVMYVVNTGVERIGAKTDVEIIGSMLSRGYIVSVFDYKNNAKAVTPGLDWSTQNIRKEFLAGNFFTDKTKLPAGSYYDNFVVPAGYDLSYANVFFEADKHASDGSLEKIVENWNTDLKNWNNIENKLVYWRNALGEQKKTEDGAEWFSDAAGEVPVDATAADANYTKVKYTIAEDVTDCVGPDGTPIDLNLYMHIVYPTTTKENPIDPVPVAVLASSSEYLNTASTSAGLRPQHNGFLFNGYAGATFDYLYQPMAQSDYWKYYDGQTALGAITGDRMNYGLHLYSDKKINTAAMRFIRYLTYTQGDTFAFDDESIGVFGNSKGGWFTFLGEAEVREYTVEDPSLYTKAELEELINDRINSYTSKRQFQGHRDETRYDNGIVEDYTKNGVTIDGGELQPWLTYTDENGNVKEILGYASWIYASNGAQYEDITEGHAPVFSALHLQDDFTTTHNLFAEVTKGLDIPSMYVIVDLGHTFAYGPDYYLGYDTYQAMFDFANYYLKKDAVKVIYTDPVNKTGAMSTTAPITVKFSGAVPGSEVEKITLTAGGVAVNGTWTSQRGNTEWTFEHEALIPGAAYTLTVPATLAGDNGKAMGEDYTATYYTESEGVYDVIKTNGADGAYFTVTVPDAAASDAKIRFYVSNDAANIAELYTVSGFDAENPVAATKGELVSSVALSGAGYYEIDVTEYVLGADAGSALTFLLSAKKTAGVTSSGISFASSLSSVTLGSYVRGSIAEAPDGTSAAKVYVTANIRESGSYQYPNELPFYANATTAMTAKNLFGYTISENDIGRTYKITVRLYDTDTRIVQLSLNRVMGEMVHDKVNASYNFMTEAGKWQEFSFDYTVYEPDYGSAGLMTKDLTIMLGSTGKDESPIYISDITVTETTTDVSFADADLVLSNRGSAYKDSTAEKPFSVGSTSYATLREALQAVSAGGTVILNKNHTLTVSDTYTGWGTIGSVTLDLNGYKLYATDYPLVNVMATTTAATTVTVKGGDLYLSGAPLMAYADSTAAGKGKAINLNLESLNVLNADGSTLKNLISDSAIASASGAAVNVNMSGVNVDYRKAYNTKNPVTLLSNGSASLEVNYVIKGGSFTLDGISGVEIYNTFRRTELVADASGNYTAIYLPEGTPASDIAVTVGSTLMTFESDSADKGIAKYTARASANATKFGIVPDEYADADAYPFILFDENGNFKGAYSKWLGLDGAGGVIPAARNYVVNAWNGTTYGANPKEAFIVLRRNYTYESAESYDNLAQTQGTINVDLGGYTLSASTYAKPILAADSKGFSGAAGQKVFPTTVNFTNGKLMHGRSGIVSMKTWDSVGDGSIVNKDFSFNFTNVTFGFVDGADTVGLIAHALNPTTKTYAAPFFFTYNDCTFDLRSTMCMYNSATIFNTNTSGKYINVTHTVNGGTIIADNPAVITVVSNATDNYGSSVVFGKGSDGNYLSFRTLTSATAPTGSYKSDIGENIIFEAKSTDGSDTIYTLGASDSATDYGIIGSDYLDVQTYPFVVFNKDGGFIKGYATLGAALSGAKTHMKPNVWDPVNKTYGSNPLKATILLRRDYTTQASEDSFNDMAQAQGEITLDLGGHTITQGSGNTEGIFGETKAKGWSDSGDEKVFPSTYTIINGSFKVLNKSLFVMSIWETVGDGAVGEKLFTINMKNVNVGYASGATALNILVTYAGASASSGCTLSKPAQFFMNLEDCSFDLKTNGPSNPKLFNAYNEQWVKNTITVKGGSITAKTMTKDILYAVETVYGSSVTFDKNSDGKYTTLTLNSGNTPFTEEIPGANGTVLKFAKESSTLYSLSSIITKYGVVPEIYGNTTSYPLAVFQNGWFVAAYNVFADGGNTSGALAKAKELTDGDVDGEKGSQVEILFRGDASATNTFPNVGQILGTIVIDLNGNTLTQEYNSKSLFGTVAKNWMGTNDAVFNIFNGNLVLKTALLSFDGYGSGYQSAEDYKTFKINFDNVNVSYAKSSTPSALLGVYSEQLTDGKEAAYEVSFNDCTFDLTNAGTISCIFNANDTDITKTNAIVKVELKGGSIVSASKLPTLYNAHATNGSYVKFGKNTDGNYTTVTLPADVSAPDNANSVINENGVECVLVKVSENNTNVNYSLYPKAIVGYKIQTSVTLYSNFVYNIYIPTANFNSVSVNGNTVDYEEVEIEIGGVKVKYYRVAVSLPVAETLGDINLKVTLNSGSTTIDVSWTLNILSYAKAILSGEFGTETKTLMKDMLVYASSSYSYFGNADEASAKLSEITAILGDYSRELPTGTAMATTDKYFNKVEISLAEVPTFRFYLNSGYTADAFAFKVGERSVNATLSDDETYLEIKMYAYMMLDTITYSVNGTEVTDEGYNIYNYYEFAKNENNPTLLAIVEALMKYAASAADYRKSVIAAD